MPKTLAFLVVIGSVVTGAQTTIPFAIDSSAVMVTTRVPFNGMDYFIAIVPLDSANIDNMPFVVPGRSRDQFHPWIDSLEQIIHDSLLRRSPQREDFPKPRQPKR
ncbi:MAG: hypothetical protein OEM41_07720 [Ignavibacteria bacterium]|nr:hypothetical protein [Ignavibacteria bacterium]